MGAINFESLGIALPFVQAVYLARFKTFRSQPYPDLPKFLRAAITFIHLPSERREHGNEVMSQVQFLSFNVLFVPLAELSLAPLGTPVRMTSQETYPWCDLIYFFQLQTYVGYSRPYLYDRASSKAFARLFWTPGFP